ncbi:MAG: hypothetical protein H7Z37_07895 [Pyrinomonadaceae bacterium]|nr:hypothetical protein [Pyrinomonadaceae bacterium]
MSVKVLKFVGKDELANQTAGGDEVSENSDSNANNLTLDTGNLLEMPENIARLINANDEMQELRRLLLTPEQSTIERLQKRIEELQTELSNFRDARVSEISKILPDAVALRGMQDDEFPEAMQVVVENSVKLSVERQPQLLADAMFPIFAPAIAKSIADALQKTSQSFNQTLEMSLSPRSIRWRIEALQTGKSFADVVLMHTLLFRVEQVFLIHQETGLLLAQASANVSETSDADMLSGMLTAIQDFVRDSFQQSAPDASLDALRVGDLSVWVERGQYATIAAVIRGNAPVDLRQTFAKAVKRVHLEKRAELAAFDGETETFATVKPKLEECLDFRLGSGGDSEKKASIFTPTNVIGGLLLTAFVVWSVFTIVDYWRWSNYLERLKSEAGVVVTEATRGWWKHRIAGLRDPLAINPDEILPEYELKPENVETHWESYYALAPKIVLMRAKMLLKPSQTVNLTFENGVLTANGTASQKWIDDAAKFAPTITSVERFDNKDLLPIEEAELNKLKTAIESQNILFVENSSKISSEQNGNLMDLTNKLEQINEVANQVGKNLLVESIGYSSDSGGGNVNSKISQIRAEQLLSTLTANSAKLHAAKNAHPENWTASGSGVNPQNNDNNAALNYRANIKVNWR